MQDTLSAASAQLSARSKRDIAVALAECGFHVFPLKENCTPAHKGWQNEATCDPGKVAKLWADIDYNIGIATGRPWWDTGQFLNVLDVDVKNGKRGVESLAELEAAHSRLPKTFSTRTSSGGSHHFLLSDTPLGSSVDRVGKGLDVRGAGGYAIAPRSVKNGKMYTFAECAPMAPCPEWLFALAGVAKPRKRAEVDPNFDWDCAEGLSRAAHYLANEAPEAVEGAAGDQTTYNVICKVRDFGVSPETAFNLALEHYNDRCGPPWDPEDLHRKVMNVYEYAQNAPGALLANVEFGAVEVAPPAAEKTSPKRSLYAVRWDDSRPTLDRAYLIKGMVDLGAMVVTYGDSNAGKTYIKLDQARCIAAGEDWNGHKVKQGLVVYIASEGGTGFHKRIEAYRREYGLKGIPFSLVPCPVDLHSSGSAGDTDKLIRLIRTEEAHFGIPCVLIIIDTLARAMGAGDENTSVDMGLLVRHCDRLRAATGATVDLIHHTGKDKARGARGSSALRAATDTEIEIRATDDGRGELVVTKQRDMSKGQLARFVLRATAIGEDADGEPVTACVVEWRPNAEKEFEPKLTGAIQEVWEAIEELFDARRSAARSEKLTYSEMLDAVRAKVGAEKSREVARGRLNRALPTLKAEGLIQEKTRKQYVRGSVNAQGR